MGRLKKHKRPNSKSLVPGTGGAAKTIILGIRDRESGNVHAEVAMKTDRETLHQFIEGRTDPDATVYTDKFVAYRKMRRTHQTVRHGVREYVRGRVHVNGAESFWAVLQRAHMGIFHKLSPKHLQRYINEFASRHNIRDLDTMDQMKHMVAQMIGKRLNYDKLKTPHPHGLDSFAQEARP